MGKKKIGRNAPCPCGSGRKYKKCCGRSGQYYMPNVNLAEIKKIMAQVEGKEEQRKAQQGLGKPIISTEVNGIRFVAVGNELYPSNKWKTFHDFLNDYLKMQFGQEWGQAESKKTGNDRHPIFQWLDAAAAHMKKSWKANGGEVQSAPMIGAIAAYINLAYNLYLLGHNVELQQDLITRLKNIDQFHGAYYETYVFGALIKAGFHIELEDESDGSTTHCECVASHGESNKKYSVEAKARNVEGVLGKGKDQGASKNGPVKVVRKLRDALLKESKYQRIVFIDPNVPDKFDDSDRVEWLETALQDIRKSEETMEIKGAGAPSAYVFVTNFPYHHDPEADDFRLSAIAEGFKIPDFKVGKLMSLRDAINARDKHKEMYELLNSLTRQKVPATFDGEIPEFAFRPTDVPRLKIGDHYIVPDAEGKEVAGELVDAIVGFNDKEVTGVFRMADDKNIIVGVPINDDELKAYKSSPDTFFGVYRPPVKHAKDSLDLYDAFIKAYQQTPKNKLLEFMKGHPDIKSLEKLSREELAKEHCIRLATNAAARIKTQ